MASPFLRHALIFGGAASATYWLSVNAPATEQSVVWLAGAAVLGVVAGVIGRGWLGVCFLVLGAALGPVLEKHMRLGPQAAFELTPAAPTYVTALVVLLLAYGATLFLLFLARRRR